MSNHAGNMFKCYLLLGNSEVSKLTSKRCFFARNFGQKKAKISSFENSGFNGFNVDFGLLIFYRFAAEKRIGWKIALSFKFLILNVERVHFRCPVRQIIYLALEKVHANCSCVFNAFLPPKL